MKREFLETTIPGITKEQMDAIMAEYGKGVEAGNKAKEALTTLQGEVSGYKQQLADRDKDIKALQEQVKGNEGLTKQLSDLQTKYEADTKALQESMEKQRHAHAAEALFANVDFSSALARKAAMADFMAKGYKLNADGKFAEGEGFIAQLRKDEPTAFKPKEPETDPSAPPIPKFTSPMSNKLTPPPKGGLGLTFNYVRTPPKSE